VMQLATDSGALAGTRAVRSNPLISSTALATVVDMDTTANGFTNGAGGVTIDVCRPGIDAGCTSQYAYGINSDAVKVTITQPRNTFFSSVLGLTALTVRVSSIASSSDSAIPSANIIVLDNQCTSGAFSATGGAPVTVNGSIWVNSCDQYGTKSSGGTDVTATAGIYMACTIAGTCGGYQLQGGSSFAPLPALGGDQIDDPLAYLPEPVPSGPTFNDPKINSGTVTLLPGIYDKGITIQGGNVNFAPGIYFIANQPLTIKGGANVTGSGVMFYAYNRGELQIQGSTTVVTMSAPSSGIYRGIFWFQQRSNDKDCVITAGPTVNISGTFYVSNPVAELDFSGNSASGTSADYTVFVVWRFKTSGGATFNSDFTSIGGSPLKGVVALAE